jgi:hypothetical protein
VRTGETRHPGSACFSHTPSFSIEEKLLKLAKIKGEVLVEFQYGFEFRWDHHPFPGGLAKFKLPSKRELKMLQKLV